MSYMIFAGACGWAALVEIRRGHGDNDKGRNKAAQ